MADLFGLDIAGLVADSIAAAGNLQDGALIKFTQGARDANDPTAEIPVTETSHVFQGFLEFREFRRPDTLIPERTPVLTMLGGSISPAAVPAVNDAVELAGVRYQLTFLLTRDPAAAVYEFQVK